MEKTTLHTDLIFFTNEPGQTLLDYFEKTLKYSNGIPLLILCNKKIGINL